MTVKAAANRHVPKFAGLLDLAQCFEFVRLQWMRQAAQKARIEIRDAFESRFVLHNLMSIRTERRAHLVNVLLAFGGVLLEHVDCSGNQ